MSLADLIRKVHGPSKLMVALDIFLRQRKADFRESGWHPSAFCGECSRKLALEQLLLSGEKEEIGTKLLRIFDVGKAMHDWYQHKYLGPMGILWGKWKCQICSEVRWGFMPEAEEGKKFHVWRFLEVPFKAVLNGFKTPVVGHADGLIVLQNKWYLLEMKTINDRGFHWLASARVAHVLQGQIYGELARQKLVRECPIEVPWPDDLLIFYIGKNDSQEKEFVVPLDTELGKRELRRPLQVEIAMRDKVLPVREAACDNMSKDPAKACSMVKHCFGSMTWEELVAKGKV